LANGYPEKGGLFIKSRRTKSRSLVLGVDAAWTLRNPSGLALIEGADPGYRIKRLARSYEEFTEGEGFIIKNGFKPTGSLPDFEAILRVCESSGEGPVSVIAFDMPLSLNPITRRRASDNLISREYGSRGAGTHSPSPLRPGELSDRIRASLLALGYGLGEEAGEKGVFIEVYPHASLIELFDLKYRFPYKVHQTKKYWPSLSLEERRVKRVEVLNQLLAMLARWYENLAGFLEPLDPDDQYTGFELKGREDLLDALICALTGGLYLEKRIHGYGDSEGKIWVPKL